MKKLLFIIVSFLSVMLINSCREEGEWGDNNGGQFGFTVDRDTNFIERGVGETNQLKFNINPSYDFNSIATTFKFTTNFSGILKLSGQTLNPNQEYTFTEKDNTFEYIGNVPGTHDLKISVKNEKGASKEVEFELKYSISEFTLTHTGGTADIFQGDETIYNHKIVPNNSQNTTGYQIRFDTYDGEIKFNGVPAQLNQFYLINNIDNFSVALKTNVSGQGKLTYTIKNPTVSKPYEIQQTVIPRQIVIESMNVNSLNVLTGTPMSLTGVIKKTPITTNTAIEYKTWISSASNNNINGIQNTNNVYVPYALGSNGSFHYSFNSVAIGDYTYNIQFKDEFGNESQVKSFEVKVEDSITFEGTQTAELFLRYDNKAWVIQTGFDRNLKIHAGGGGIITSITYTVDYDIVNPGNSTKHISNTYVENAVTTDSTLSLNGFFSTNNYNTNTILLTNYQINNRVLKVKAKSSTGFEKEISVNMAFNGVLPL